MIPKQIYFIWIGKLDLPSNINYVLNIFKEVNPDFKIDLIYEKDIFNTNNRDIIRCRDIILKNDINDMLHGKHIQCEFYIKVLKNNIIQKICDILREELLYNYGGIYLDCDTFPVSSFDNEILKLESFTGRSIIYTQNNRIIPDNFFMGSIKGIKKFHTNREGLIKCDKIIDTYHMINFKDQKFLDMKNKFDNCLLKYGDRLNEQSKYIDHYDSRPWKKYCDKCDIL